MEKYDKVIRQAELAFKTWSICHSNQYPIQT